jgi:hypothetical protein
VYKRGRIREVERWVEGERFRKRRKRGGREEGGGRRMRKKRRRVRGIEKY